MTAREELAAVLAEHRYRDVLGDYEIKPFYRHFGCSCGWEQNIAGMSGWRSWLAAHETHAVDALLASPALAREIREAKAEAWDKGQAGGYICAQGYHAHGDGHGPDSWDCDCPNPYRDEEPT